MKREQIWILFIVIVIFVGVLLLSKTNSLQTGQDDSLQSKQSDVVPTLTLSDFQGRQVKLTQFVGKPLVINSWASWCPFCRTELPDFVSIQKELGDKVIIIAINRAETPDQAKGYIDTSGLTDSLVFLLDPRDEFYKAIGGIAMPETVFINKEGKIVDHKIGVMDKDEIQERIAKIL